MESQVVRQRVNIIAAHLAAAPEDISATATHIFPMSCRSTVNSVIRRLDNRVFFARPGSESQGCFMRQVSNEQQCHSQPAMPLRSYFANKVSDSLEAPIFSRPAKVDRNIQNVGGLRSVAQSCRYNEAALEAPKFARPNQICKDSRSCTKERTRVFGSNGARWSPRMNVAESGRSYVVTVELPGVRVDDIRVEVSNQNLMVTGNRSDHWSKGASNSNDSISAIHRREIFQGPYQAVWSLPANADKDRVSAEFVEGLLRITIPKLSGSRMMKANI